MIIDAEQQGHVLLCTEQGISWIEGLTLVHGLGFSPVPESVRNSGGGLFCSQGDVIVSNCVFRDNEAFGAGGGMFCGTSSEGGILGPSSAIVTDCRFVDNHATVGGGLGAGLMATVELSGCVFADNSVNAYGGGIFAHECLLTVTSCTLFRNEAPYGGGGLGCYYSEPEIHNCIIAFSFLGEAVYGELEGLPVLHCCDLFGNAGGDWVGCIAGQVELFGNFSADPCFCDAGGGDYYLCGDSTCLPGHHPWGCEDLVGALGQGCGPCNCPGPVALEFVTWGTVKTMYR